MKTKLITFKMELKGRGVVNYDSFDCQKSFLTNHCDVERSRYRHNNVKVAKKDPFKLTEPIVKTDINGNIIRVVDCDYNLKISSDCLKNAIFSDDAQIHNTKVYLSNPVLAHYTTSIHKLLRGYASLSTDVPLTRKSALFISDAIQTSGAQILLECHSNSGPKEKTDDEGSTSLYYLEQVGHTHYEAEGTIKLKELQFMSADPSFGRMMLKPEWFEGESPLITRAFEAHYGKAPFKIGYFTSSTTTYSKRVAEFGIRLSDDFIKFLVREQLKRLLNMHIIRARGIAYTTNLKVKLVEDGLGANFESNEGWIEINADNVDSFDFDMFDFYDESSEELVSETKGEIERSDKVSSKLKKEKNTNRKKKTNKE